VVATSRRGTVKDFTNEPCFLSVVVDGVLVSGLGGGAFDLRQLPPPDQVMGLEVFNGAASIPAQYGGEGAGKNCGLIAVWTR
jgi:hypothetical protein